MSSLVINLVQNCVLAGKNAVFCCSSRDWGDSLAGFHLSLKA